MSEYINNSSQRQEILKSLIRQLHEGKPVEEVKEEFARILQQAGPSEIGEMEQALIAEGIPESEVKRLCDVHVAVFRDMLDQQPAPQTVAGHPVDIFRAENRAVEEVLNDLQEIIEAVKNNPQPANLAVAQQQLEKLREYEKHYLRKENILFPYLERHNFSGPSSVMWAIHDDIRAGWKALYEQLCSGSGEDPAQFTAELVETFTPLNTAIREMIYKEENILFPTALEKLDAEEWQAIQAQGNEIGYSYIEVSAPVAPAEMIEHAGAGAGITGETGRFNLDTGSLSIDEINLLFGHLPVEISYVDRNDAVRYFSQTKERIFPRTPAVIGRKVQQCHPPASVDKVQQILDDFRTGHRDVAEFWIQMRGRFIHIRYFAVRDSLGEYQGTLEVVQDITDIRTLEGERRLLDDNG